MKQTAVEWLVKEFSEILGPLKTKPMQDLLIVDAINQAKQMEKEQIMMAHCHNRCLNNKIYYLTLNNKTYECSIKAFENSEQYYNETFNTKEK